MVEKKELNKAIENEFHKMASMALYNNLIWWATGKDYYADELNKAFNVIDEIFLNDYRDEFVKTIPDGTIFYRGRKVDNEDYEKRKKGLSYNSKTKTFCGYNWEESKEPPADKSAAGRLSRAGEAALYLASDEITAAIECRPDIRQLVSIAEFQNKREIKIINFSKMQFSRPLNSYDGKYDADARYLLSKLHALFTYPVYEVEEYVITQKIVDHFREKGYEGFAYKSFFTGGTNYTFFDESREVFSWNKSRILLNYTASNLFVSLDETDSANDLDNKYMVEKGISEDARNKIAHNTKKLLSSKNV